MGVGAFDSPQARLDVGKEHGGVVRLGHKVVGTQRHGHNLVKIGGTARNHDDGHIRDAAQLTADYLTVGARQAQVEQHEIGRGCKHIVYQVVKRSGARHLITSALQEHRKLIAYRLVVFNDIYMHICIIHLTDIPLGHCS